MGKRAELVGGIILIGIGIRILLAIYCSQEQIHKHSLNCH